MGLGPLWRRSAAIAAAVGLGCATGCTGGAEEPAAPPCDGGGWGAIGAPNDAAHVRNDGDDSGDGSQTAPFATLQAALDAVRAGDASRIAVGPGTFETALDLDADDRDLVIEGCGADQTDLTSGIDGQPVVKVTEAVGVSLAGLTLSRADRPLFVWGGAEVAVAASTIDSARWSGFVVDGPYTLLDLDDVTVSGSREVGGVGGFGGEVDGGTLHWRGGAAVGNTAAGIVASGSTARIELSDLVVADTQSTPAGVFGRGVQIPVVRDRLPPRRDPVRQPRRGRPSLCSPRRWTCRG